MTYSPSETFNICSFFYLCYEFDLSKLVFFFTQVKTLLSEGINRPRKGHDAGDHPPITPMRAATEAELGTGKFSSVGTMCEEISPSGCEVLISLSCDRK